MKEIHGVRVKRLTAVGVADEQTVTAEAGSSYIYLRLGTATFPAAMTAAEARFLSTILRNLADQIDPPVARPAPSSPKPRAVPDGATGGAPPAAPLSPERRSEIASLASHARWAKRHAAS